MLRVRPAVCNCGAEDAEQPRKRAAQVNRWPRSRRNKLPVRSARGQARLPYEGQAEVVDCPEDLSGNGQIGLEDLTVLLGSYGAIDVAPEEGDVDGDRDVDLNDLSRLLSVYGQDCPTR
jgi:hypothetical protein